MRLLLIASCCALAFSISALPAAAQDVDEEPNEGLQITSEEEGETFVYLTEEQEELEQLEKELADSFAIFGELFAAEPLTEEQQALLPLATRMADRIFPVGTFDVVMQDTMQPMMDAIFSAAVGDPRNELTNLTGIAAEDLAKLDDDAAQSALDVLDPVYAQRNERMGELVTRMVGQLFDAMEPAYRDALARALTSRFDEAEMQSLLAFFDTPLGGKFARESFLVQYDPQMLGAMEAMGPAIGEIVPEMMEEFAAFEQTFPQGRTVIDLSEAERGNLARLLGKSVAELDALAPEPEAADGEEKEPVV